MSTFVKLFSDADDCRGRYGDRFAACQPTRRHTKNLRIITNQSSPGESRVQREVWSNKLIDARTSELPFTHQAAQNSGTGYDVASARAGDRHDMFPYGKGIRCGEFRALLANLCFSSQQNDISTCRSTGKRCSNRLSRARNDTDLGIVADSVPGGQNQIGSPQEAA